MDEERRWTAPQLRKLLGRASFIWDDELGMHVPVCSRLKYSITRGTHQCGVPLDDADLESGTCPDGPHLERHERSI